MHSSRLTHADVARLSGTGLISTGLGLLIFVLITITWGDPFTGLQESGAQDNLGRQYAGLQQGSSLASAGSVDPRLTRAQARDLRRSTRAGHAVGRIVIPKIDVSKFVVKGTRPVDLEKGPGIYRNTGFPGNGGPVAIAGHRTTHGAPFLNIDRLRPGDLIYLEMPYARITYQVTRTRIISTTDWSILDVGAAERSAAAARAMQAASQSGAKCPGGTCEHLVMTACHPKYSAAQRIAVFSRPVAVQLRGRAR